MRKIVLIMLALFVCSSFIVVANEKDSVTQKQSFFANLNQSTSSFNPSTNIVPFASESTSPRVNAMRGLAIAGIVTFALSWPVWIAGVAMFAYGYYYIFGGAVLAALGGGTTALTTGWILYYTGIALLGVGLTMLVVGIPMMVVGFILYGAFKKKDRASMFFKPDYEDNMLNMSYGISIKI